MAGSVIFKLTAAGRKHPGDEYARALRKKVKQVAKRRGIKVPKHMTIGGAYYHYFHVCYTNNQVRDLIVQCSKDNPYYHFSVRAT